MEKNKSSWGKRLLTAVVIALFIQVPRCIIEERERGEELKTKFTPIKVDFSSKEINLFSLIYLQLADKNLQTAFLYSKNFRITNSPDSLLEKQTAFVNYSGDYISIFEDKSLSFTAYNIYKNITPDSLKYYGFEYAKHGETTVNKGKLSQDYYVNRPKNLILSINHIQENSVSRYFVNVAYYDAFIIKANRTPNFSNQ